MSSGSVPLRLCLVGCGDIATTGHLPAIARSGEVELVAVVDTDETRRLIVAERYGCAALADHRLAFAARGLDATIVATPPEVTPGIVLDALRAGLDVLCEKPMATTLEDGERVAGAAAASGRIVQVGFKNRFSPLVVSLRRWIEEGLLGAPLALSFTVIDEPATDDRAHRDRIRHFLRHGPAFVHEGAHYADLLRYLSGREPTSVTAVGVRSDDAHPSENYVCALVRLAGGGAGRIEIGWLFAAAPSPTLRVLGPLGLAELDRAGRTLVLQTAAGARRETLQTDWNTACFDAQLGTFAAAVRSREPTMATAADGVASLRLTLHAVEAMRTGSVLSL